MHSSKTLSLLPLGEVRLSIYIYMIPFLHPKDSLSLSHTHTHIHAYIHVHMVLSNCVSHKESTRATEIGLGYLYIDLVDGLCH
jgi:hypothetical protein